MLFKVNFLENGNKHMTGKHVIKVKKDTSWNYHW